MEWGVAMAMANNYLSSQERCKNLAKRSANDDIRQAWLNLAESYEVLLMFEKIELCGALISGKRVE
jgi:hypothetical protein